MASDDDKRLADKRHNTKEKAVKPQRERTGPYASEVEDYKGGAIKSPRTHPDRNRVASGEKRKK